MRKNTITGDATRKPLSIIIPSRELSKMYAQMLYIEQQSSGAVEQVVGSRVRGFHDSVVRLDSEERWEVKGKAIVNRKGKETSI